MLKHFHDRIPNKILSPLAYGDPALRQAAYVKTEDGDFSAVTSERRILSTARLSPFANVVQYLLEFCFFRCEMFFYKKVEPSVYVHRKWMWLIILKEMYTFS